MRYNNDLIEVIIIYYLNQSINNHVQVPIMKNYKDNYEELYNHKESNADK